MTQTQFSALHVVPEGRDMLAFSCVVPDGWVQVPLPVEEHDFENPTVFLPALLCMAPYGAVVFTIAARPAFDDGSVQDWAEFLASRNNLEIEQLQEARIGRMPCVLCDAIMPSEAGTMRSRSVFLEDGGRLFNIGTLAPQEIWSSVEPVFHQLLGAFKPDEVKGITTQPLRLMTSAPAVDLSAPFASTTTDSPPPIPPEAAVEAPRATEPESPAAAAASDRPTQAVDVALADDASSLDPDHPVNARLRDSGVGLVPRIIMTATRERFVTVGAAAIESLFRVPFGWHVIDDGKRTLVFDAGGLMQISLDLRVASAGDHIALLQGIGDGLAESNPEAQFLKLELMGRLCLGVRNLVVNGEALEQAYLVQSSHRVNMALVCRVTADSEHMTFALNTAEVILTSMQGGRPPVDEEFAGQPDWWRDAVLLEREDRLLEAEDCILGALDHLGVYSSLAHLHELRMARLSQAGDTEGAREAKKRAIHWLQTYASGATSGGEGAALSLERDQRIAALGGA